MQQCRQLFILQVEYACPVICNEYITQYIAISSRLECKGKWLFSLQEHYRKQYCSGIRKCFIDKNLSSRNFNGQSVFSLFSSNTFAWQFIHYAFLYLSHTLQNFSLNCATFCLMHTPQRLTFKVVATRRVVQLFQVNFMHPLIIQQRYS